MTSPPALAVLSAGYGLSALAPAQRAVAQRLSAMAHRDMLHCGGRASLTGHCGHGCTCSLPRPVAIDIRQLQDGTVKKGLHRPRLSAIIPNLTAAGSHPDCRAVLIQIVAL